MLKEPKEIIDEGVGFHHKLLGQASPSMPAVHQRLLKKGAVLTSAQQLSLIKDFTKDDVLATLKGVL